MRLALLVMLAAPVAAQDAPEVAAAAAVEKPSPKLGDSPEVQKAKEAYNGKRYNEAARRFLKLAQADPMDAALYRALARARSWSDDPGGAVVAYRFYLDLADDAGDRAKVEAEMQLAERKVSGPVPAGPPAEAVDALEGAPIRARAGRFAGDDGAYGAIDAAISRGYLGPRLHAVRQEVAAKLLRHSQDAVRHWWLPAHRVKPSRLEALTAGWQVLSEQRSLTEEEAAPATSIAGLTLLRAKAYPQALEALNPVAPSDPRLRYAQAIALAGAGRAEEAIAILGAMGSDDPRVPLLRGLLLAREGKGSEAAPLLRGALE